jgi:hypothetical protein
MSSLQILEPLSGGLNRILGQYGASVNLFKA